MDKVKKIVVGKRIGTEENTKTTVG